jgi:hypothetical protein
MNKFITEEVPDKKQEGSDAILGYQFKARHFQPLPQQVPSVNMMK